MCDRAIPQWCGASTQRGRAALRQPLAKQHMRGRRQNVVPRLFCADAESH
jgi:hypothetical protein